MAWKTFPYPCADFEYTSARLKRAWATLHKGDVEPWPGSAALVSAWIDFHAGRFKQAADAGLALGLDGYTVANKATCMQAVYLADRAQKCALLLEVAERCTGQQQQQPRNASAFYWHAFALGRHAQEMSILEALARGVAGQVKASLDTALRLAPRHADAHIALGVYHAEIIAKVGAVVGSLTYGASRDDALRHFREALALNPESAIARVEYARGLVMLGGRGKAGEALALCEQAAASTPHDAMERLDIERARQETAD
jgi:tetratricopeptide (TPR) repeat protein